MVLAGTTTASAQKGPKYNLSLVGFSMPSTAMLNETITVSGYIQNNGSKSVPADLLVNYLVSMDPADTGTDNLPTFAFGNDNPCLLYTSPSPRDLSTSRMPSSA